MFDGFGMSYYKNAPMPFVNSSPRDFVANEVFDVNDDTRCRVSARYHPGEGFALLEFERAEEGWRLHCTFDRADGEQRLEFTLT